MNEYVVYVLYSKLQTGQSQARIHVFIDARGANRVGDDVFEVVPFRPHF